MTSLSALFVLAIGLPLIAVLVFGVMAFADLSALWSLAGTVLPEYLSNTVLLCLMALVVALVLGVSTAWLLSQYQVPFARILEWGMILPMAMPAYVVAYAYTDALDYSGWVSMALRESLIAWGLLAPRVGAYPWFEIRSLWGAALILGVALSPYVALLARTAFDERQANLAEAARLSGLTSRQAFFRVILPMARPALVAGGALVIMECLADYGTVAFFSVQTLSTGLFKTWFSYGDRNGAALIGLMMLAMAFALLAWERAARGGASYAGRSRPVINREPLRGLARFWVPLVCSLAGVVGFVIPMGLLLHAALTADVMLRAGTLLAQAGQTALYASYAVLLILPIAVLQAYVLRSNAESLLAKATRLACSGYAVPGLVVAVGLLAWSALFTQSMMAWFDWRITLTVTSLLVVGGYLTRFFTVGFSSVETSMARITPSLDWSARSLGLSPLRVLQLVHLPILRRGVLVGGLLVFVDVVKELPITLVLRPFNVETLAVAAHHFAADERLADAAWPSIAIALVGLIPVLVLGPRAR
jgi:iron(III) transport system permease protein